MPICFRNDNNDECLLSMFGVSSSDIDEGLVFSFSGQLYYAFFRLCFLFHNYKMTRLLLMIANSPLDPCPRRGFFLYFFCFVADMDQSSGCWIHLGRSSFQPDKKTVAWWKKQPSFMVRDSLLHPLLRQKICCKFFSKTVHHVRQITDLVKNIWDRTFPDKKDWCPVTPVKLSTLTRLPVGIYYWQGPM